MWVRSFETIEELRLALLEFQRTTWMLAKYDRSPACDAISRAGRGSVEVITFKPLSTLGRYTTMPRMIRPILRYGEEVLARRAESVSEVTSDIQTLIDDMIETMYAAPGVGLAAPQIGIPLRLFVADPSVGRDAADLVVMINPTVVEREGTQSEDEGCLSVPGFTATVSRAARVVVRGLDRDGESVEIEGTGLLARTFQHELDHLNGSMFLDQLRGLKRQIIVRKINKLKRNGKW